MKTHSRMTRTPMIFHVNQRTIPSYRKRQKSAERTLQNLGTRSIDMPIHKSAQLCVESADQKAHVFKFEILPKQKYLQFHLKSHFFILLIPEMTGKSESNCPSHWMVTPTAKGARRNCWQSFSVAGAPGGYSHEFQTEVLHNVTRRQVATRCQSASQRELRQKGHVIQLRSSSKPLKSTRVHCEMHCLSSMPFAYLCIFSPCCWRVFQGPCAKCPDPDCSPAVDRRNLRDVPKDSHMGPLRRTALDDLASSKSPAPAAVQRLDSSSHASWSSQVFADFFHRLRHKRTRLPSFLLENKCFLSAF